MRALSLCLLFLLAAFGGNAHSNEPIRIIVPFAAGGPVDTIGRILIEDMQRTLGETIIIESRGGAGGVIGTGLVARSAPDGKTLLLGTMGSHVLGSVLRPSTVKYDPATSFEPIAMIGFSSTLMIVPPELPVKNFADFVALAKKESLNFGSAGPGSSMHIAGELLNLSVGAKMTHVGYRGAALAIPDLLAGRLQMIAADPPVLLPLVEDKKAKPLVVFGHARLKALPDIPTTIELGYGDMIMENWYGLMAPAGTPPDVIARLEKAALAAIASPAMQAHMTKGEMSGTLGAAEYKARITKEVATWRRIVNRLGIQIDGEGQAVPAAAPAK